jgi:hypothetical protein
MSAKPNNLPANNGIPKDRTPPAELIQVFLTNQGKELELKAQELALNQQSDKHSFEYAKTALDASMKDREASRTHSLRQSKTIFLFVFAIFVSGAVFLGFTMYSGKDAIAMEIIKATIFLISGGSGGYAVGRSRKKNKQNDAGSDDENNGE